MPSLRPDAIPLLSPHAVLEQTDGQLMLETPHNSYILTGTITGLDVAFGMFDGSCSMTDVCERAGLSNDSLLEVCGTIEEDDLVDIRPVIELGEVSQFLRRYYELCDAWGEQVFSCPFWNEVFAGTGTRRRILGWCMEFYHRTLGADEHNELSVRNCADPDIRQWLTEHFEEELGHGEMFLRGLVACGFSEEAVATSRPLPSTRQLIEHFNALATTDSVAYLGCYGVMHSPRIGQTAAAVREQFGRFATLYPFAAPAFEAVCQHATLDIDLGHDQIVLEKLADRDRTFSPDVSRRLLRAAHSTASAFNTYFAGIHEYYGSVDAELPRSSNALAGVR